MDIVLYGFENEMIEVIKFYMENKGHNVREVFKKDEEQVDMFQWNEMKIILINYTSKICVDKEFCVRLKKNNYKIIAVVQDNDIEQIKNAFEVGVDDILRTPIEVKEILMRIMKYEIIKEDVLYYKTLKLNIQRYQIIELDEKINLSKLEFDLLVFLIQNKGKLLKREHIMEKVWKSNKKNFRVIDVYIAKLRKKSETLKRGLISVKSLGYRLEL